jgi:hypothetical protein
MRKFRVVKRHLPGGIVFVVQTQRRLLPYFWVDAWRIYGEILRDYFTTLVEAEAMVELLKEFKQEKDIAINDSRKDITQDPRFWQRLRLFVQNVHVADLPGMEEKDMILSVCSKKIGDADI